ncbi:MAG: peptidoglycan editing factor PgeF [Ignavibacteria bacterium]|nr:peptidoglycan editing factor PgeF [Ignavibacteria bacterium]
MKIIYSEKFKVFPEIVFGISTIGKDISSAPYFLNMSCLVGDKPENVAGNRRLFFEKMNIDIKRIVIQKQIHSDNVNYVTESGTINDSDGLFTDVKNLFLTVCIADCYPVFLYHPAGKIIACIHSGWKGTFKKISHKAVCRISDYYKLNPKKFVAFIGPGISAEHFEVGSEVAALFEKTFVKNQGGKYFVDLKSQIYNQLIQSGIDGVNIETSGFCTFKENELLHSYRRDKNQSGRMFGVIGLRQDI